MEMDSAASPLQPKIKVTSLNFFYGQKQALIDISMDIQPRKVTALIGPSGCGKSTFLRCLNRMNDTIANTCAEGHIYLDGEDILAPDTDLTLLRQRVGMVFQKPNPFPQSIFNNVAFGPRVLGLVRNKYELSDIVKASLEQAGLYQEVRDDLDAEALGLSLGQQQRLCIARAVAVRPEVILMDEPASALDPIATQHIEELIAQLKQEYTIVIVTHNMQQAARVSDDTGLFWLGKLVEFAPTQVMFTRPKEELSENYITGRVG